MREAWRSEPLPITDPDHPTGLGTGACGRLVIGWGGHGREVVLSLTELDDPASVRALVGRLSSQPLPGMTAAKLDFLVGVLHRRLPGPGHVASETS